MSPMLDKTKEMLLPGELEYRTFTQRKESGIPLSRSLYYELADLGHDLRLSGQLIRVEP